MILAPVIVSATALSRPATIGLGGIAVAAITLLAFFYDPLPWPAPGFALPEYYMLGVWQALVIGILFIAAWVGSVSEESRTMSDALVATQVALSRAQRLSELGALAAAAAHELGSPLATIAVVAKEMRREVPKDSALAEDVALLIEQSDRCREILAQLSRRPEQQQGFDPGRFMPLAQFLDFVAEPYRTRRRRQAVPAAPGPRHGGARLRRRHRRHRRRGPEEGRGAPPAYAVVDMRLDDGNGLDVIETIRKRRPESRMVVLTGYGNIATAVTAVKLGAIDYLAKPADADEVHFALTRDPATRRRRRRIRCRPTASAGSTSSASTRCATATSRRPRAGSTCTGGRLQRILAKRAPRYVTGCLGFGVLLGFAVLARIDVGFLAVALALWVFVRGWREGFVSAVARPLAMGVAAIVVSSPWWIYNHVVFGSIVPSSGTAQQSWGLDSERLLEALWALRMVLVPWIFAGASESLATDLARSAILALALALFLFAPHGSRRALASPTSQRTSGFGWCLFAAMCALAVFYVGSFFAYWFYFRYFAPLSLLAIIGAATVLGDYATRGIVGTVSTAVVLAIVAAAGSVLPLRALDGRLGESPNYPMVDLVAGIVPPGDVVAAGQSGTLGFFRERVVNVDGKVNREALAWQDRMWVHLAARDIRWFVDSPWYVERMLGKDPAAHGWQMVAVAGRGEFQLWRRD
jgi:ActR/RegA family two-component response regulator